MTAAVEEIAHVGLEGFDAAFEHEGREDIGFACVVEVAQEVGEDPPSPKATAGQGGSAPPVTRGEVSVRVTGCAGSRGRGPVSATRSAWVVADGFR